ncbi:M50 family metallopeptidase [Candidatus Saccharibacteria bacterium]|nr:M50 family metallopeptidase [Candidatus Saccharibacteria bacterium]
MMTIIGILVGLIILTIIVTVHEFGHYIAAKRAGVKVEEFAIGMGPLIWSKKDKHKTLFSIRALPVGGFCRFQGGHDAANKKGDYGRSTFWQKTQILLAGVVLNWLLAVVIFTTLALTGMPQALPGQFHIESDTRFTHGPVTLIHVVSDSPAYQAGLQSGDEILQIANTRISYSHEIAETTRDHAGETVSIIIIRDDAEHTLTATLRENNDNNQGFLGVSSFQGSYARSTWSAPIVGVGTTIQFTIETFRSVGQTIVNFFGGLARQLSPNADTRESGQASINEAGENIAGPVGIIGVIFPAATQAGATTLLFLAGVISLGLAVMNLLPLPALDGGRWLLMVIFRALKRPLTKDIEEKAITISFLSLIALIIVITIADVTRLF